MAKALCNLLLIVAMLSAAPRAFAHAMDAAFLSLTEVAPGRFAVKWRAGSATLEQLTEPAVFPPPCRIEGAYLECGSPGLAGAIQFPWMAGSLTHLALDIEWLDHSHLLRSVAPSAPQVMVYEGASGWRAFSAVATDYGWLGVEHIAGGFDHLLFVVALTLLVRGRRLLLLTVTAFTLAHSLSLAATVLGALSLPSAPVEATIALSIVLVCAEGTSPQSTLMSRAPWIVAFVFGLLHGLGFASALLDIGLPRQHLPLALVFFNLGVEAGQLGVVAVVLALGRAVRRLNLKQAWLRPSAFYAIGSIAAAWSIERVAAVFGH